MYWVFATMIPGAIAVYTSEQVDKAATVTQKRER